MSEPQDDVAAAIATAVAHLLTVPCNMREGAECQSPDHPNTIPQELCSSCRWVYERSPEFRTLATAIATAAEHKGRLAAWVECDCVDCMARVMLAEEEAK